MDIQKLIEIGGNEWKTDDGTKHRIYFNDIPALYGLTMAYYNTGNISSAWMDGEKISNYKAKNIISGLPNSFYFDVIVGDWQSQYIDAGVRSELIEIIEKRMTAEDDQENEIGGDYPDFEECLSELSEKYEDETGLDARRGSERVKAAHDFMEKSNVHLSRVTFIEDVTLMENGPFSFKRQGHVFNNMVLVGYTSKRSGYKNVVVMEIEGFKNA